jgi:hypothetical protein
MLENYKYPIRLFLKEYIYFSIVYKRKVRDKLNIDLKFYIWNIYRTNILYSIIRRFYKISTTKCDECLSINWSKTLWKRGYDGIKNIEYYKTKPLFYFIQSCENYIEPYCNSKKICIFDCKFKIKCNNCKIIYTYIQEHSATDIGLNPIEGKKFIHSYCPSCEYKNIKKLL